MCIEEIIIIQIIAIETRNLTKDFEIKIVPTIKLYLIYSQKQKYISSNSKPD